MKPFAEPVNGDVAHCEWYVIGESRHETVHLWDDRVNASDSWNGERWEVRFCIVCGAVDTELLEHQARARRLPASLP